MESLFKGIMVFVNASFIKKYIYMQTKSHSVSVKIIGDNLYILNISSECYPVVCQTYCT